MKYFVVLFYLLFFVNAACASKSKINIKTNAYWQCQCWLDKKSSSADMLIEFESKENIGSLVEAQNYALTECKKNDAKLSIATCLKWVSAGPE